MLLSLRDLKLLMLEDQNSWVWYRASVIENQHGAKARADFISKAMGSPEKWGNECTAHHCEPEKTEEGKLIFRSAPCQIVSLEKTAKATNLLLAFQTGTKDMFAGCYAMKHILVLSELDSKFHTFARKDTMLIKKSDLGILDKFKIARGN